MQTETTTPAPSPLPLQCPERWAIDALDGLTFRRGPLTADEADLRARIAASAQNGESCPALVEAVERILKEQDHAEYLERAKKRHNYE